MMPGKEIRIDMDKMNSEPVISIDLDARCRQCGEPGACENGLCLKCIGQNLEKGANVAGHEIVIPIIEGIVILIKEGVTRVQFEAKLSPAETPVG